MPQVRSAADSAKKFVTRAKAARQDYADGVKGAGGKWKAGASAAGDAWKTGTQDAINNDTYTRGVSQSGTEQKYQNNATKLGPDRFAAGVDNAADSYSSGVAPFLAAMSGADYGAKGAKGSQQNRDRIGRHIDLMRKTKREKLGING
jgi:phage tail tape-measure protein